MIVGYDDLNAARAVALDYGEGAHLIDTNAQAYHPIAQEVSDGELVYVEIGGWAPGSFPSSGTPSRASRKVMWNHPPHPASGRARPMPRHSFSSLSLRRLQADNPSL